MIDPGYEQVRVVAGLTDHGEDTSGLGLNGNHAAAPVTQGSHRCLLQA